jgi:hypothetical protein
MRMKTAPQATSTGLGQLTLCAALATLTTLGIFSLIATVMPPLLSDPATLANHEAVSAPSAGVMVPHANGRAAG